MFDGVLLCFYFFKAQLLDHKPQKQKSKTYLWATELENVHSTWKYSEKPLIIGGKVYDDSEDYYQLQKPEPFDDREWKAKRDDVMRRALLAKVLGDEDVLKLLWITGDNTLVSLKNDSYWGFSPVHGGYNQLGVLWMDIRRHLQEFQDIHAWILFCRGKTLDQLVEIVKNHSSNGKLSVTYNPETHKVVANVILPARGGRENVHKISYSLSWST